MFSLQSPTATLTMEKDKQNPKRESQSLEQILSRLSPLLSRTTAETAGSFFSTISSQSAETKNPKLNDKESLQCSQKNIGEKFEMICNLSVAASDWEKIFSQGESDRYKVDAFCEMANCICGNVIAEPEFSDVFGYLIPCVPWSVPADVSNESRSMRGAFRLAGITVYYAFSMQANSGCLLAAA